MSRRRSVAVLTAILDLRLPGPVRRLLARPSVPIVVLVLILALSTAARVIHINQPCSSPCTTPAQHTLIFDEAFYVNAARAIARVHQPSNSPYSGSPAGKDPNAEHPQLAKVVIAGGIKLFGDNAWGWRIGSIVFSLIAMIALYALVTGAGGSRWLGVGTVGVMALDNLALVHGRIATLDIYVLAMMLIAGAFYVRRRPLLAGIALGIGMCMKEVAFYLLAAVVLYEVLRFVQARWAKPAVPSTVDSPGAAPRNPIRADAVASLRPVLACVLATWLVFFGALWALDALVPAWDPGSKTTYAGNPFAHFGHIVHFANLLKANAKHPGISSTPLQWLIDKRTINYATTAVTVTKSVKGLVVSRQVITTIAFKGEVNPFIIFFTLPALAISLFLAFWRRDRVALFAACWAVGTYAPFFVASEILNRTSYLFYILIVMPGIYMMEARVFSSRLVPRIFALAWAGLMVYGFVELYPFRTLIS